jgi:hypothetical protein
MKWSWKLGEFCGIGVYMHATLLILIAVVVAIHWSQSRSHYPAISADAGFGSARPVAVSLPAGSQPPAGRNRCRHL